MLPHSRPGKQTPGNGCAAGSLAGSQCHYHHGPHPLDHDDLKTRGGPHEKKAPETCPSPAECSPWLPHPAAPADPPPALCTQMPSSCFVFNQDSASRHLSSLPVNVPTDNVPRREVSGWLGYPGTSLYQGRDSRILEFNARIFLLRGF